MKIINVLNMKEENMNLKKLNFLICTLLLFICQTPFAEESPNPAPVATEDVSGENTLNNSSAAKSSANSIKFNRIVEPQEDVLIKDDSLKVNRLQKFIMLTLGIEHDEQLPPMPANISFKGDFKKVTQASYSKEGNNVVIRFKPLTEGIATLTIHDKNGRVVGEYRLIVKKSRLDAVVREMQTLLGDIEGIQIKIINNKVIVDGQILLPRDMNRIYNVVSQFGDLAASLVTLSPIAQKKIAEFISRDINNPEIEVRAINDKFMLQGVANSEDEKARAEIIAKAYVPDVILEKSEIDDVIKKRKPSNDGIVNLITVKAAAAAPPAKIIQLVLHYVELKKDYGKGFNFQFTPSLDTNGGSIQFGTGSERAGGVTSEVSGVISNLLPKLNWAKNHGHARVLESTSLLVQDGQKGVISAGSEIPTLVTTQGVINEGKRFVGLSSDITPVILGERSDSINMNVTFNVEAPIGTTKQGIITSKNFIQTALTVRSGQSAAIGGLISNSSQTSYNRPDRLPANPILSLYASKDFQRNQSQFVVFITPIIKSSASAGSEKIKKKFRLRD